LSRVSNSTIVAWILKQTEFNIPIKEWGSYGRGQWWINRGRNDGHRNRSVTNGETGIRLMQRYRKLISETKWSISKRVISYSMWGWCWRLSNDNVLKHKHNTYAQKSSTVLKVVITFWFSSQSFVLSFLKYQKAQQFCSGCFMYCSATATGSHSFNPLSKWMFPSRS